MARVVSIIEGSGSQARAGPYKIRTVHAHVHADRNDGVPDALSLGMLIIFRSLFSCIPHPIRAHRLQYEQLSLAITVASDVCQFILACLGKIW